MIDDDRQTIAVQDVEPSGLATLLQDEFWGDGEGPEYDFDYWASRLGRSRYRVRLVSVDPIALAETKASAPGLVSEYASMIEQGRRAPPIVILGSELVDGAHRVQAAVRAGAKEIYAIRFADRTEVRRLGESLKRMR